MKDEIKVGDTVERIKISGYHDNEDGKRSVISIGDRLIVSKLTNNGFYAEGDAHTGQNWQHLGAFKKVSPEPESLITKAKAIITQLEACAPLIEELKEITSKLNEEKYDYPLYMRNIALGNIVQFESLTTGIYLTDCHHVKAGEQAIVLEPHTNTRKWQPCEKPDVWTVDDIKSGAVALVGDGLNGTIIYMTTLNKWSFMSDDFVAWKPGRREDIAAYLNDNKYTKGE